MPETTMFFIFQQFCSQRSSLFTVIAVDLKLSTIPLFNVCWPLLLLSSSLQRERQNKDLEASRRSSEKQSHSSFQSMMYCRLVTFYSGLFFIDFNRRSHICVSIDVFVWLIYHTGLHIVVWILFIVCVLVCFVQIVWNSIQNQIIGCIFLLSLNFFVKFCFGTGSGKNILHIHGGTNIDWLHPHPLRGTTPKVR